MPSGEFAACGAAGGGFSTITCVVVGGDFRPRESVQVALTVIGPADAPVVLSVAVLPLPELQTFRRTLMRWRREILAYFGTGLTNARTEGFNNKAKLVKKRAYGYRSFRNYRLRLLNACA